VKKGLSMALLFAWLSKLKLVISSILSFTFVAIASAQDWSAKKLLSDPDKNLGTKVNLFIYYVGVPALNATDDLEYRDFSVYTAKRNVSGYDSGGYITVRVPRKNAAGFTKKYGTSTDYKQAKVFTGIFRSENGNFIVDATGVY